MRHAKAFVIAIGLALGATFPAVAGPHEDGDAAYFKGDYAEAAKQYRLAAEKGDAQAQFNLGRLYQDGQGVPQNYAEAMKWHRLAAEQGDASAQNSLGVMYHNGQGVAQNYADAMKWYRLSAEQGNAIAQLNLAVMYDIGRGVLQNYAEAAKWFRRAAEQGDADAQNYLGTMYSNGQGVAQDYILSHMWYNLAAASSDKVASGIGQVNRDLVGKKMTPAQIAEAQKLAINPTWGAEAQTLIEKMYTTPPALMERVRKIVRVSD